MNSGNCPEFTVGFCPNEEFYVEEITKKCPLNHSKTEQEMYFNKKISYPFERPTLAKLKEIVLDVDKKVKINNQMLLQEKIKDDLNKALTECQKQIEITKTTDFDFQNMHSLLILHGKLINHYKENKKDVDLAVCDNCSCFYKINKQCEHMFCKKYKALRQIVNSLIERLQHPYIEEKNYL